MIRPAGGHAAVETPALSHVELGAGQPLRIGEEPQHAARLTDQVRESLMVLERAAVYVAGQDFLLFRDA